MLSTKYWVTIFKIPHMCLGKRKSLMTVAFVVAQLLSHVRLCESTNCSTPGLPVPHYLPEFAQVHFH